MSLKRVRRVVTATDNDDRSFVLWDSPAPGVHESEVEGKGHIDVWAWAETPLSLEVDSDPGTWDYEFPGPVGGGHLRVVSWFAHETAPGASPEPEPFHEPIAVHDGRSWERGGGNNFDRTPMHKTESIDYGIVLAGQRQLILDDYETTIYPGAIVVQVGAWHLWDSSPKGCLMAFDMIGTEFVDGPQGLAQGNDPAIRADSSGHSALPEGVRPQRRIVTIDRERGRSSLVADSPAPAVISDPARPGFTLQRMWVVPDHPPPIVYETLQLPHVLVPPTGGSVLNVLTIPPDDGWRSEVGSREVSRWYESVGAPEISTLAKESKNPFMQRTRTVDFCFVLEGQLTLELDREDVDLAAGDIVVQRATNHAWSNRSKQHGVVAIASHDAL